jgi:hypothetical protein
LELVEPGKRGGKAQRQEGGTDAVMEGKELVEPGKRGGGIHEGG